MQLPMKFSSLLIVALVWCCSPSKKERLSTSEFTGLMNGLAEAWSKQNTQAAVNCFAADATYMQPPDEQFYTGHAQLTAYFGALKKGTVMTFHHLWFDAETQTGAGEFTFGNTETQSADTGVVVVSLENGKIKSWREYFIKGPLSFQEFISTENKNWKWHIGNYP
jgi:hypothetical protein